MVNVNCFEGVTDSERIQNAINNRESDGIVLIPPRDCKIESERKFWLLDQAILLP